MRTDKPSSYLQHVSIHVLIWTNLLMTGLVFIVDVIPGLETIYLVLYLSSFVFILPSYQHSRRALCFHCIRRPPDFLRDDDARLWWLSLWHRFTLRPMVVVIVCFLVFSFVGGAFGVPYFFLACASAAYTAFFATFWISVKHHARLIAWCPLCRHRGDTDVVEEPSPPLPEGTKSQ